MSYNYVVTAHKPTAVTASVTGNFISPTELNLIVARNTRLTISTITEEGIRLVKEVNIYGRISVLKKFRYLGENKDLLFYLTDKYNVAILEIVGDHTNDEFEVITRSSGVVSDPFARASEVGNIVVVDQPRARLIAMRIYDGLLKIIPLNRDAKELCSYNIRMEETQIVDFCFLPNTELVLAVLHEEQQCRHIRTHVLSMRDQELLKGTWSQRKLDCEAEMLIPVDDTDGGVIIVGGESILYHWGEDFLCIAPSYMQTTRLLSYCKVDNNRYLLSGTCGGLFLLFLNREGSRVTQLTLELLGSTSIGECLSYLDNGVVFVGSRLGDSQLIRIEESKPFVKVLETYTNLGPIPDMVVVDLEKQGQGQLITCSGAGHCGSLRIIRNGIGIHELACVELSGIKGIWALRLKPEDTHQDTLVLSFVRETRVFDCGGAEELKQISLPEAFDDKSETFCARNVRGEQVVQITNKGARLISVGSRAMVDEWLPVTDGSPCKVTLCGCNDEQIALALKDELVYLEIRDGKLEEIKRRRLGHEIACLDLNPLAGEGERTALLAVGLWTDVSIQIISLPDLEEVCTKDLPKDVIPRSVLKITFEFSQHFLLCTLADGSLYYYKINLQGQLSAQKRVTLGTQPTTLKKFRSQQTWSVFACSDRPTVIYCSNAKLVFSKVNLREVKHMCSFSSTSFPDCLALSSDEEFIIGTIDAIQKLHIRTVPLGETPKRIAYQEETGTFGVIVSRQESLQGTVRCASLDAPNKSDITPFNVPRSCYTAENVAEVGDSASACCSTILTTRQVGNDDAFSLLIIDQNTFEVLHAMKFQPNEYGTAICSAKLGNDPTPYYIIGTTLITAEESDSKYGRIVVLRWMDGKLEVISEKDTGGTPYCIREFHQKLVISISPAVRLYSWNAEKELQSECTPFFNIVSLHLKCHEDYVLVGDLMRSVTLLQYNASLTTLEEVCRDYHTNWTTAIEILDSDSFLVAETNMNLYVCKKDTIEERHHLQEVARFHLGEMVNVLTNGSLVMAQPGDVSLPLNKSFLFGTVHGMIGVIMPISQDLYNTLMEIQTSLEKIIKSVGKIDHTFWRTFNADRKIEPSTGFIDGDLIETVLDLPKDIQAKVAQETNIGEDGARRQATVDDLVKLVEDFTRIH